MLYDVVSYNEPVASFSVVTEINI